MMAPKFGTSGLRGLVSDLTPALVRDYTAAFLAGCATDAPVRVGWDLRPSSPDIAESVIAAIVASGRDAIVDGPVPTPALALMSLAAGQSAVMVTGSHIPANRNGLKFYTAQGEISKADETAILTRLGKKPRDAPEGGQRINAAGEAQAGYVKRYVDGFGDGALGGLRIGVYQHSSVARQIMMDVVTALGAKAVALGWSDRFVPVDTEAVDPMTRDLLAGWCSEHGLDALISSDGDADRPMVVDANGRVIAGDVLGALCAMMLGADTICTPVSSNTMIDQMPQFAVIHRTQIGSPYVIAAMENVLAKDAAARLVGYEANGGFLVGFSARGPNGPLAPLMTRDFLLPILAPLYLTRSAGCGLAELVDGLPRRFTATDRLTGIEQNLSAPFLVRLCEDAKARAGFFDIMGAEKSVDLTDGLRLGFESGDILHLRPSGNAPEFRCYVEAETMERAQVVLAHFLDRLRAALV